MKREQERVSEREQAELNRLMQEDEERSPATPDQLALIVNTSHELQRVMLACEQAEEQLERLKKERQRLEGEVLPGLMNNAGLKELTLEDGYRVEAGEAVYANLSKANAPAACQWLEKQGYGGIVKTTFTIPIPKGPQAPAAARAVKELLALHRIAHEFSKTVHPQTLLAFVKESLAACRKLPPAITVHQQPRVVVRPPKES